MVPQGALGGNQAIESAACFINNYRQALSNSPSESLSLTDISNFLDSYAKDAGERATKAIDMSSLRCKALLRIGEFEDSCKTRIPNMTEENWLMGSAQMYANAIKLENWSRGSERADYYGRQSEKIKAGATLGELLMKADVNC